MPASVLRPAATQIEWWIRKGETYDIVLPVLDGNSALVNVTGWTAKAQIRRSTSEPLLHEWSAAQANIAVAGTTVTLNVLAAQTAVWAWTDAEVDVEVYEPSGKPHCIAAGVVHAIDEITQ